MNAYSKKSPGASERDEEDRGARRRSRLSGVVDPSRSVLVDGRSANVRMVPLRARAPKVERAFGTAPGNGKENVALFYSVPLGGMGASSMGIGGPADGEASWLQVEHFLCPSPERGQIVVVDKLQVRKTRGGGESIEEGGCRPVFLPSYSPDLGTPWKGPSPESRPSRGRPKPEASRRSARKRGGRLSVSPPTADTEGPGASDTNIVLAHRMGGMRVVERSTRCDSR
jgi:hypothetical protein